MTNYEVTIYQFGGWKRGEVIHRFQAEAAAGKAASPEKKEAVVAELVERGFLKETSAPTTVDTGDIPAARVIPEGVSPAAQIEIDRLTRLLHETGTERDAHKNRADTLQTRFDILSKQLAERTADVEQLRQALSAAEGETAELTREPTELVTKGR